VPLDREARLYRTRQQSARVLPQLPQLAEDHRVAIANRRPLAWRDEHEKGATFMHVAALEHNAPPSVLVDDRQRIVNLSASAGRFILHSGGPFANEVSAVVRPELRLDLKTALERAFETRESTLTLPAIVAFDAVKRRVAIHVMPTGGADEALPQQALIFFLDGGEVRVEEVVDERDLEAKPDEIRRLQSELKIAHERLNASRRENEIAIQDLRAANEELQSINEEYRSTAEELETSKEELQSMNEELQTVNAELKTKLETISSAHSDLRNLTLATEIGTLFLDPELRIRMFTPPLAELFNITEADVGRAITHFTHQMIYEGIERDARRVLRDLVPFETVVESKAGRSYMMRVRPYRTMDDRIDGIVITFVDITARLGAERQLRESEAQYRRLFDSIDEGFCVIDVIFDEQERPCDYRFIDVNEGFERQTGLVGAVGKTMRSLSPEHEQQWYEVYGRVAVTRQPQRFEQRAASLGRYYEVYAFPAGEPHERKVGILFNDVSVRKESEVHLKLMVDELNHRVKNTLAVVQAIAHQTFKQDGIAHEARHAFEGRLAALALAHDLLTQTHWEKASLRDIASRAAVGCGAGKQRFIAEGPDVDLHAGLAVSIAMALHELCTNAVKYGAFSTEGGRVYLRWEIVKFPQPTLRIVWEEQGGPSVTPPSRRGFGSMMVEHALAHEFKGSARIEFMPQGVVCTIEGPLHSQH
jgi:two-component system CheB/CheR fusion protein